MRPSPKKQIVKPRSIDDENIPSIFGMTVSITEIRILLKKLVDLQRTYENLFKEQNQDSSRIRNEVTKIFDQEFQKFSSRFNFFIETIKTNPHKYLKIERGLKGEPGKDADEVDVDALEARVVSKIQSQIGKGEVVDYDKIIQSVAELIPKPTTQEEFKLTLEMFVELAKTFPDDIFEIRHIKNLEERLRNLGSQVSGIVGGGQGSWKQKQVSGTIDGNNTVFTFSGEEPAEYSERIFLNYIEFNPFTDYAINYKTNTITYTRAPDISLAGSPHIIRYM